MSVGEKWSLAVGVLGILVTAGGFILAVIQLNRTANAAEATKDAVERTEKRTTLNHLLVLLPQFRMLESDLDYAAESDDRTLTMRALVAYAHVASEVATLMRDQEGVDNALLEELEATSRAAARVKAELVTTAKNPKLLTSEIRVQIGEMASRLTGLASGFRVEAGR